MLAFAIECLAERTSAQPLRKEKGSRSKSEKLVCRDCGSDDLAPSFTKRRDRRCRKCFSKRHGSAAPERKAKPERYFGHDARRAGLETARPLLRLELFSIWQTPFRRSIAG